MAHTPGPWHVDPDNFNGRRQSGLCASIMDAKKDVYLAEVWADFEREENDEDIELPPSGTGLANAQLIAAAPDLLAALQATLDLWGAAGFDVCDNPNCGCVQHQARAAIAKAEGTQP